MLSHRKSPGGSESLQEVLTVVSNMDRSVKLVSEYLLTQGLVGEYGWDGHGSQASPERCEHTFLLNKLKYK